MKAIVYERYGGPEVLRFRDVPTPALGDSDVLVRVKAAGVNPLDWHFMRGSPYIIRLGSGLTRPRSRSMGADVAGVVEAVGGAVTGTRPGDEVFGWCKGAFAEYARVGVDALAPKPERLTFEQAAAVPIAAITALQAVRDHAKVKAGSSVLVIGASGGVGTFAVQIAKAHGAEVTGVCSGRNAELVRSLGATRIVDYTVEDFADGSARYDVVLHLAGNRSVADCRRVLKPRGTFVLVGQDAGSWVGPVPRYLAMAVMSPLVRHHLRAFVSKETKKDLLEIRSLIEEGRLTPAIDRTFALGETAAAVGYVEQGHARGKVVVLV